MGRRIQAIQQPSNLGIDEGDTGQIGAHGSFPLLEAQDRRMGACRDGFECPFSCRGTQVIEVVSEHRGQLDLIPWRQQIKIPLRRIQGDVRPIVADGQEKGL